MGEIPTVRWLPGCRRGRRRYGTSARGLSYVRI